MTKFNTNIHRTRKQKMVYLEACLARSLEGVSVSSIETKLEAITWSAEIFIGTTSKNRGNIDRPLGDAC